MDRAELERVIRESLEETKSWGWSDEARRLSASGSALKYLEQHGDMDHDVAITVAGVTVREIMAQDEPLLRPCPYCGSAHEVAALEAGWRCPLSPDPH